MTIQQYPRSPKMLLGGIAHLARFIDKIRLRHAGLIQDYNYITVGFDKHLIEFLHIDPKAFEALVLAGQSEIQPRVTGLDQGARRAADARGDRSMESDPLVLTAERRRRSPAVPEPIARNSRQAWHAGHFASFGIDVGGGNRIG